MDKQKKARIAAMEADRAEVGLSYRALGTAAGVSDSRIRDAIKDVSNMTDENWAKVAAALPGGKLAALLEKDGIALPAPAAHAVRQSGGGEASGVRMIPFGLLRPNPHNYRKTFLPEDIEQLAESIAAEGLLQNLVVFPAGKDGIHTINSGGRRYAALNLLFNARRIDADYPVACLVKEMKQEEARALALIENLQRQDVPVLEEAEGFKALTALGWDTEKIAAACHIAQRTVQDRLQLFDKLKPVARAALSRGEITLDQARAIVSTPVEAEQNELVTFAVRNGYNAAALRDKAKAGKVRVSKAAFDLKHYKGEFIGTGADRVFADTAAFIKLQLKEAKRQADELRASGRFRSVTMVEEGEEGFDWETHAAVREEDVTDENAATLDVWVSIDRWQNTIDIDYGKRNPDAAAAPDADDPFAEDVAEEEKRTRQLELEREIARKRREEEAEREAALAAKWQRDLSAAVAERPADYFRREILLALTCTIPSWWPNHLMESGVIENLPATLEILQEATGRTFRLDDMEEDAVLADTPRNEHLGYLRDEDAAFLTGWLDDQPDLEVIRLHVRLEASRSVFGYRAVMDRETHAMSQKLGVTVPDHLLPEPEEKDEEEDGGDLNTEEAA